MARPNTEKRGKVDEDFKRLFGKYPTEKEREQFLRNKVNTFQMAKDENSRLKDLE